MSDHLESTPYTPQFSSLEEPAPVRRTRLVPAAYERQVREAHLSYTGSPEVFLTVPQEQEIARAIQDGLVAQAEYDELNAHADSTTEAPKALSDQQQAILARIHAGKDAERVLVECNLRLSGYLARASMNILPTGDREALSEDSKAGRRRRSLLDSSLPWLPRDFTQLKSPHAELDDRIQIANMGLLNAARKFSPGMLSRRGKKGALVPFVAFASQFIKSELARYVKRDEKPIHFPEEVDREIGVALRDDWDSELTPERREQLLQLPHMQEMIPFEELYFAGAAVEEIKNDYGVPSLLSAAEVIPTQDSYNPVEYVLDNLRCDAIDEVLVTLSEREAGVIRLRYGLDDGRVRTLKEIGEVFGITRERVRQIESAVMTKLRHRSRSYLLEDFVNIEEVGDQPMRAVGVIKTRRGLGRSSLELAATPEAMAKPKNTSARKGWQAYPGESWDEPVRKTPEQLDAEFRDVSQRLRGLIFDSSLYTFQKSFTKDMRSPYPKLLVERITKTFGHQLTAEHIAGFWNEQLEPFLERLEYMLGDDASPNRAVQLLSRLLSERMTDNDVVVLNIPESQNGKLGYVGAWLSHGTLRVIGDAGDYAGYEMDSLGHLQVEGTVQHFAGSRMGGNARLEIDGDTGDFTGFAMRGSASILINGDVGKYCGCRMWSPANRIEVLGVAGAELGHEMHDGEIIVGDTVRRKQI